MTDTEISRRGVLGAAVVAAAATAGLAPSAEAATETASSCPYPGVITGHADSLHPEGMTWDPRRKAILLSSTRHGTASILNSDGSVTTLVGDPDPKIVSTVGIAIDLHRNRLLLGYHDLGLGTRSTPETYLKESGLGVFDLNTGRQLFLVDLSIGDEPMHAADRVAIDKDGTAYVSDPAANKIYKVTTDGHASVLADTSVISPGWQLGTGAGVIGLLLHPAGFLLTLQYSTGQLVRIPLKAPHQAHAVTLDRPIVGGDSIALRPDGTLLVVSNDLANPEGVDAVIVLRPTDRHWDAAHEIQRVQPWPERLPTDVLVTPHGDYTLSGRPDLLFKGETTDEFVLHRI
ncbi:gluconolaconase [Kitasatospora sp. NBC_00070]|uniref:gluconolaconase n=1 Tax=Kitasatospora sp. NBC_00070 TaxID=2975962 RepID=UPI00324F3E56